MVRQDYEKIYSDIAQFIKFNGIKIIHRQLSVNYFVDFRDDVKITIDSSLKNSLDGCFSLSSAYEEYLLWREGSPQKFAQKENVINYLTIVYKNAQRKLLQFGVDYIPSELTNGEFSRETINRYFKS